MIEEMINEKTSNVTIEKRITKGKTTKVTILENKAQLLHGAQEPEITNHLHLNI